MSIKYLSFGLKKKSGINNTGRKMLKNRSSGAHKRKFRIIDYYRVNYLMPSFVIRLEYDPNRSSDIALICYRNGMLSYIIATVGLRLNAFLSVSYQRSGVANLLQNFPLGSCVSCVELRFGFGAKIARSAGAYCTIVSRDSSYTLLRLPSGIHRYFSNLNKGVLGIVSKTGHKFIKKTKAGNNRWIGLKPTVRGVAKNCVDHPNGGGRGKTSPWSTSPNFTGRVLKGVGWASKRSKRYKKIWLL